MTRLDAPADASKGPWAWHVIGLLVLAGWLAGVGLAQPALVDPDEPRTAIVARLMAEGSDWLAPHLPAEFAAEYPHDPVEGHLLAYWDKPPLNFWLAAGAMKVLGPMALAARLPSALAFVITVLLVYAAGRFLWSGPAGFWAGLVMAVAPLPLAMAHVARMDSLLAALMAAMLLAILHLLYAAPRRWLWVLVLYGSAGLGLLTKGPEAVVFPAAAVGATVLLAGRWRDLLRLRPLEGAVICLAVAAPWYLYMHMRYPAAADGSSAGFLYEFLIRQHLGRAAGGEYGHTRAAPGLLIGAFLAGLLPWTLFLPGACASFGRQAWRDRRTQPALLLLAVWAILVIAAFSLSRTQFVHYILPAFAPAALVMGLYLAARLQPADKNKAFRLGLAVTLGMGIVVVPGLVIGLKHLGLWHDIFWIHTAIMLVVVVLGAAAWVRRHHRAALALIVGSTAIQATFILATDPFDIYATDTTYRQVLQFKEMPPQAGDAITAFPFQPYSFVWYLWDRPKVYWNSDDAAKVARLRREHLWDRPVLVLLLRDSNELALDEEEDESNPQVEEEEVLVEQLNVPYRTFCVLQKRDMAERLRRFVRWPIRLLTDKRDRFTMIVTGPEVSEKPNEP
jgi:4-amino-4-deoxy-L-arabinose transferase-like glycosyltransferase